MRRIVLAAGMAALAVAAPGSALLHDLLGGGDAHSGRDADNACQPNRQPTVQAPYGDSYGQLTPVLDTADHYLVRVQPLQRILQARMDPSPPTSPVGLDFLGLPNYDLGIRGPDCQYLPTLRGDPNPSQNGGTAEEEVIVLVPSLPPFNQYLVVEVFSRVVPTAGEAPGEPAAKAGPSDAPRGVPWCYPMCYKLSLAAV